MRGVILTYARKLSVIVLGVGLLLLGILGYSGRASGDFDLSQHSVPLNQILSDGPGGMVFRPS